MFTSLGMRRIYCRNQWKNKAVLALFGITVAYFAIMMYLGWNMPMSFIHL